MPVEIFLEKKGAEQEYETIDADDIREDDVVVERIVEEAKTEERENEDGTKETVEVSPRKEKAKINKRPVSLSDTTPLWTKHPNDVTDDEYKEFYRKVFRDYKEPLFWIHLNMDYPFNLKGILYFPKVNTEYDNLEGVISFIIIRCLLLIILRKLFLSSLCFLKVLLTARTFLLMYQEVRCRMMDLLRKYPIILLRRLQTSFRECTRLTERIMRSSGMI